MSQVLTIMLLPFCKDLFILIFKSVIGLVFIFVY